VLILTPTDFSSNTATATSVLDWVRSPNGQQAANTAAARFAAAGRRRRGAGAAAAGRVLAPRGAAQGGVGRLRAALDGLLEDRLLSDPAELHFALEPGGRPGQTLWVAACHKAWLQAWLQVLEGAGRPVSRIVPALWPVREGEPGASGALGHQRRAGWLAHQPQGAAGVTTLPLPADGLPAASEDTEPPTSPLAGSPSLR
jgi:general secretion pathway protein L